MYPGTQQELRSEGLIPLCVCKVAGKWFMHSQGCAVWHTLPNTFPIGEISEVSLVYNWWSYLLHSAHWVLTSAQNRSAIQCELRPQYILRWTMKMNFHILLGTQAEKRIYCNRDWNNLWDEMYSGGKKKQETFARVEDLQIYKSHLWLSIILRLLSKCLTSKKMFEWKNMYHSCITAVKWQPHVQRKIS